MKIYCFFHLQYIPGFVLLVSLCILLIKRVVDKLSHTRRYKEAPQPSGALPVIGHLLLLKGPKPLSQILGDISDDYGPVFTLRLGARRVLVVNSWEGAKDCFSNNDKALASRPAYAAGKHMGYDYAMLGFAPYGAYWRTVRKIATTELLSNARLEALKHVRLAEVDIFAKELYAMWDKNGRRPVKVDLKRLIGDLSYNFIASVVAGKRYFGSNIETSEEAWRFRKAVGRLFSLLNAFVVSDMFPLLKGFDLNGKEAAMKSAARDLDLLMSSLIKEHRERRVSQEDSGDRDFVDVMLSTMDDSKFSALDSDKVIKATSLVVHCTKACELWNLLELIYGSSEVSSSSSSSSFLLPNNSCRETCLMGIGKKKKKSKKESNKEKNGKNYFPWGDSSEAETCLIGHKDHPRDPNESDEVQSQHSSNSSSMDDQEIMEEMYNEIKSLAKKNKVLKKKKNHQF